MNAEYQHWQAEHLAAYQGNRALRARLTGMRNLAVTPPNTPANEQVKDSVWGNLVGQKRDDVPKRKKPPSSKSTGPIPSPSIRCC